MKIKLIAIGRTDEDYLKIGIQKYVDRLKHYISFEFIYLNDVRLGVKTNVQLQKEKEGKLFLEKIDLGDFVIVLDEKGKKPSSMQFAEIIQKRMNASNDVVFLIGGPFGFSDEVYQRANDKLSLSSMTFSHQMIRLLFVEQLYRAFTIIKREKYHHE